ncbi:hypothetical protein [Proteiniphilum sp.]|uniref:hypothetical protein n=1 Tax=Proteiniphilum sp. TaxID=1926877 RepID=UPI00331D6DD3
MFYVIIKGTTANAQILICYKLELVIHTIKIGCYYSFIPFKVPYAIIAGSPDISIKAAWFYLRKIRFVLGTGEKHQYRQEK